MQPLDQSSDTPSITEEIREAKIPKRKIVKPNKANNNPSLTLLQKGPLMDTLFDVGIIMVQRNMH